MLDKRLKWAFLVVALIFAGLPIAGIILDLLTPPHIEIEQTGSEAKPARDAATPVEPVKEDMVFIPAGEFLRGYNGGGLVEDGEGMVSLAVLCSKKHAMNFTAIVTHCMGTSIKRPKSLVVQRFR